MTNKKAEEKIDSLCGVLSTQGMPDLAYKLRRLLSDPNLELTKAIPLDALVGQQKIAEITGKDDLQTEWILESDRTELERSGEIHRTIINKINEIIRVINSSNF